MRYRTDLSRLDQLSAQLPFPLEDGAGVARVLTRYRKKQKRGDERILQVWTYCYVRRYFLVRFVRSRQLRVSEVEGAIETAYRSIRRGRSGVKDPSRFPHWVTVVCRNTFVNLIARRKPLIAVDRIAEPAQEEERSDDIMDSAVIFEATHAAIDRLPEYLREVARLRLVEHLEYETIAERMKRSVPTIRAYAHKAATRLKRDVILAHSLGRESHERSSKGERGDDS